MTRLLTVDNISGAAYALLPPEADFSIESATPTEIFLSARAGHCEAALLPAASLKAVEEDYETIGNYGIACQGTVGSVLLFCDLPLDRIAEEKLPIFLSEHSQTSRALMHHLYKKKFGQAPTCTGDASNAFARLLIGNDSLKQELAARPYAEIIDLSQWWYSETSLPCVFARWVVRTSLSGDAKQKIEQWLDESVNFAKSENGKCQMALNNENTFGSMSTAQTYYDRIQFRLGKDELTGLELLKTAIREQATCNPTA